MVGTWLLLGQREWSSQKGYRQG